MFEKRISRRKSAPELRDTVSRRLPCEQDEGNDGLTEMEGDIMGREICVGKVVVCNERFRKI